MPIVDTVRAPVDATQLGTTLMREQDADADRLFAPLAGAEACRQICFVHGPNEHTEVRSVTLTGQGELARMHLPL
jgi:hypothetical protein